VIAAVIEIVLMLVDELRDTQKQSKTVMFSEANHRFINPSPCLQVREFGPDILYLGLKTWDRLVSGCF